MRISFLKAADWFCTILAAGVVIVFLLIVVVGGSITVEIKWTNIPKFIEVLKYFIFR